MDPSESKRVQYHVTLGLHGADVDPTELAARFQLTFDPRFAHKRGDRFEVDGDVCQRESGFVSLQPTPTSSGDFEAQAKYLLDRVEPRAALLASGLARGWTIRLTILTVTNRGIAGPLVTAETMRRIASLGVATWWKTAFATRDDQFHSE